MTTIDAETMEIHHTQGTLYHTQELSSDGPFFVERKWTYEVPEQNI